MTNDHGPAPAGPTADRVRMHEAPAVRSARQVEEVLDPSGPLAIAMIGAVTIAAHARMHAVVAVPSAPRAVEAQDPSGHLAIETIGAVKAEAKGPVVHQDHEDRVRMTAAMHHGAHVLPVRLQTVAKAARRSRGSRKAVMNASSRKVIP